MKSKSFLWFLLTGKSEAMSEWQTVILSMRNLFLLTDNLPQLHWKPLSGNWRVFQVQSKSLDLTEQMSCASFFCWKRLQLWLSFWPYYGHACKCHSKWTNSKRIHSSEAKFQWWVPASYWLWHDLPKNVKFNKQTCFWCNF